MSTGGRLILAFYDGIEVFEGLPYYHFSYRPSLPMATFDLGAHRIPATTMTETEANAVMAQLITDELNEGAHGEDTFFVTDVRGGSI